MPLSAYMTLAEAAEALGYKTSRTLAKMSKAGQLEGAVKMGKQWLVPKATIANFPRETGGVGKPRGYSADETPAGGNGDEE